MTTNPIAVLNVMDGDGAYTEIETITIISKLKNRKRRRYNSTINPPILISKGNFQNPLDSE